LALGFSVSNTENTGCCDDCGEGEDAKRFHDLYGLIYF